MPDYKALYFQLFNRVSDLIEGFQTAQQEAESTYIESEDNEEEMKGVHE